MSSRQSSSTSRFTRRAPGFLAAVVVFLVLVSILTFPLVFNLGSRLISTTANLNEDTVIPGLRLYNAVNLKGGQH